MTGPATWWRRYLAWRLRNVRRLVLEQDGFVLVAKLGRQRISWRDVSNVAAYKRDLLTVDLLCLVVATRDDVFELDEQMQGYAEVEYQLCQRLDIGFEWKFAVLFPAFEPCAMTLFTREPRDMTA